MAKIRMLAEIDSIVVHCSDSEWGNAEIIDDWHREKGWSEIGYHYVIENCYPTQNSYADRQPRVENDGNVSSGSRELLEVGAHVAGFNGKSIGICLIGKKNFTGKQIDALLRLIWELEHNHLHKAVAIHGHYELYKKKTCPNLEMDYIRSLAGRTS